MRISQKAQKKQRKKNEGNAEKKFSLKYLKNTTFFALKFEPLLRWEFIKELLHEH